MHAELGSCPLKILHVPDTIGISIEGQPVVRGVPNLPKAFCLLFGLIYGNIISMVIFPLCSLFSSLVQSPHNCVLCRSLPHEVYTQQCRVHNLGVLKNNNCSNYINTVIIFDIAVPV